MSDKERCLILIDALLAFPSFDANEKERLEWLEFAKKTLDAVKLKPAKRDQ